MPLCLNCFSGKPNESDTRSEIVLYKMLGGSEDDWQQVGHLIVFGHSKLFDHLIVFGQSMHS